MTGHTASGGRSGTRLRMLAWGVAAALLFLPLLAMQVTNEVAWSLSDFVAAGILVGGVGLCFELVGRTTSSRMYQAAVGVALAGAFATVWINLAVGFIGSEGDPINLLYFGVLAVGVAGALLSRFRPLGMARAMVAVALAQALVAVVALVVDPGLPGRVSFALAALWLLSAWLFQRANATLQQGSKR